MPTPPDNETLTFDGWPGGVNNRLRETEPGVTDEAAIPASQYLREAINVDLTAFGHPMRREGYAKIQNGFSHSLWSHRELPYGLLVHEGWLSRLWPTGELEALQEVQPYAPMSFATVNGEVFWANGVEQGRVTPGGAKHWGLPCGPQPILRDAADSGLTAGQYRAALVYVDADGEEYGAGPEGVLDVQGGLEVEVPGSWPEGAVEARLFVSQANGEILYEYSTVDEPATLTILPTLLGRGRELETAGRKPPLPGSIVRYFAGRLWIARRQTLYFTEALRYGLTRPAQGIFMFPADITLIEPTLDGVYVGHSGGVSFLAGTDPYNMQQTQVSGFAPVRRASTRVPGDRFEVAADEVPVWWGVDGAMVAGLPGGQVQQMTKDRLATPEFSIGALLYREREGMAQVVSSLKGGGADSLLGATDTAVAEVRSNNTVLNY